MENGANALSVHTDAMTCVCTLFDRFQDAVASTNIGQVCFQTDWGSPRHNKIKSDFLHSSQTLQSRLDGISEGFRR